MDLKQLAYFVAIAEEGSITAAAKRLHISQPPLSIQLKQLELELGTVLLERTTRNLALTNTGRLLYQRACRILSLADTALKEIEDLENGGCGVLHLGTISSSGTVLLIERMQRFYLENPKIRFEIREGNTFELIEQLENHLIELAVVRTPFQAEQVQGEFLEAEPMAAVGNTAFFTDIEERRISVSQLSKMPLIYYRRYQELLAQVFEEHHVELTSFCKNDDARTSLLWAKAGLGVAIVPLSAAEMFSGEELIVKLIDEPKLQTQIGIIYRKNAVLSMIAKRFMESFFGYQPADFSSSAEDGIQQKLF